jgi:hypothetical protein
MSTFLPILLAQQGRIADMGRNFRGSNAQLSRDDLLIFSIGILAVACLLALLRRLAQGAPRRPVNSPRRLFRDLCRLHGLDRGSRLLLVRLARYQKLDHPGRLFVEPERFEPGNLGPLASKQQRYREIRERLFGTLPSCPLPQTPRPGPAAQAG